MLSIRFEIITKNFNVCVARVNFTIVYYNLIMVKIKRLILATIVSSLMFHHPAMARTRVDNHLASIMRSVDLESQVMEGVTVYYNPEDRSVDLERTRRVLREAIAMIGPIDPVCQDIPLKLFILPNRVINDREIMSFLVWEAWGNKNIWGAYDSFHEPDVGEIYVNGVLPMSTLSMTIAHEYYHYTQDIRCVTKDEQEARRFEVRFCEISSTC